MYNIASYKEFKIFFFLNLMAEEGLPKNWMILKALATSHELGWFEKPFSKIGPPYN